MTKYVVGKGSWLGITPGNRYELVFQYGREGIVDDDGDFRGRNVYADWEVANDPEKSDDELLAEIAARNPDWNLPEAPDRAESIMREWRFEWDEADLGHTSMCLDFGLFIARKLLKEGVIK